MAVTLDLNDLLAEHCEEIELLPLFHTTSNKKSLDEIIRRHALHPQQDSIFNERLIFFFYGKAQYIPEEDVKNVFKGAAPITFLFDFTTIGEPPRRMLPFDSGGFPRYGITSYEVHDFVIDPVDPQKVGALVGKLFGTNKNYLDRTLTVETSHYPLAGCLVEIKSLYTRVSGNSADFGEQACTIELQYRTEEIPLRPKTVFCPASFLTTEKGKKQLNDAFGSVEFCGYNDAVPLHAQYVNMQSEVKSFVRKLLT